MEDQKRAVYLRSMKSKDQVDMAVMANNIEYIKTDIATIRQTLSSNYVTRDEFDPIKKIVYGMVALILVGVVGAILALVLRK